MKVTLTRRGRTMSKIKLDIAALRERLKTSGLRATPARIAALGHLLLAKAPLSHIELTEFLDEKGIEKSTVFRALTDLTDAGLLRKMELGDHVWRFEAVDPSSPESRNHPHLLCVDCGKVECLDDGQVQLKVARALGTIEDILLKGHCRSCR